MGGPGILCQRRRNGEQDEAESHAVYDIPQRVEWGGGVCMARGANFLGGLGAWGLGRGAGSENRVDHACQTTRPAVWLIDRAQNRWCKKRKLGCRFWRPG